MSDGPVISPADRGRIAALLDFWFGAPGGAEHDRIRAVWFESTEDFDAACREDFLADHERAAAGGYDYWLCEPGGALALVLLLDQMPRNLFRGTPRAWATDAAARAAADAAVARGFDRALPVVRRRFLYMPFMHSESLADQDRSMALFSALPPDTEGQAETMESARRHHDIIARFGRFPHRNAILGRRSTPEEEAFLKEPNSSF